MANYSDFSITFTGHLFDVRAAYDEFTSQDYFNFKISEIFDNYFTHEPPTWHIFGTGRWGIDVDMFTALAEKYNLSGEIVDTESGSDFFIQVELTDGEVTYSCNAEYISEEHANWLNDPSFWTESYDYVLEEPEEHPEIIEFLSKYGAPNEQS